MAEPALPAQPVSPPQPSSTAEDVTPTTKLKDQVWLKVLIGVVLVALVAGLAFWLGGRNGGSGQTPGAKTPEEAVLAYLEALAAGKAEAALAYADEPPSNQTFLTDAMLATSLALNPITDITVTADEADQNLVLTNYRIGATEVSTTYQTVTHGELVYLAQVTEKNSLAAVYLADANMKLNGLSLDGLDLAEISLFPGTYQLTLEHSFLTVAPASVIVQSPGFDPNISSLTELRLVFSDEAANSFTAATQASFGNCLAELMLPNSCGFGFIVDPSTTPQFETLNWYLISNSIDTTPLIYSYYPGYNPEMAVASIAINLEFDYFDDKENRQAGQIALSQVNVNFFNFNNLVVTFA